MSDFNGSGDYLKGIGLGSHGVRKDDAKSRRKKNLILQCLTLLLLSSVLSAILPAGQFFPCVLDFHHTQAAQNPETVKEDMLYVALIWHNHQPLYKNPETGVYELPWVRLHATKDYYDMAKILKDYPRVHVTFNMVPSLLSQLQDYEKGATDKYLSLSEKSASSLNAEDKDFILRRFFDANWDKVIPEFSRYVELLDKRGRDVTDNSIASAAKSFTEEDFRDLQVLFNLAWIDPGIRSQDGRLKAISEKGRGYIEEDKKIVLQKQKEIIGKIIPLYRDLQNSGTIEIMTAPFYHPILPLLYDNALALEASLDLELPGTPWKDPSEMEKQIMLGVDFTGKLFGKKPAGMWPSEMACSQKILPAVAKAGISWIVADEGVLARSLSKAINRTAEGLVRDPQVLYSAYRLNPGTGSDQDSPAPLYILFRDRELSDAIGFKYSGMKGQDAAKDLYDRIKAIQKSLKESEVKNSPESMAGSKGPHIVTIALDGENCWEYYENDGIEFLRSFYERLQNDDSLKAVTVGEFLKKFPPEKTIENLATGSWIDANLDTWIGEADENMAWSDLTKARDAIKAYAESKGQSLSAEDSKRIRSAENALLAAEGSDWFWWYGNDQTSPNDASFDALFRSHLKGVYQALGKTPPPELDKPIVGTGAQKAIPDDLSLGEKIFEISDPSADDKGPGTYAYPLDAVFKPGDFDLRKVEVFKDNTYLSFKVSLGHMANGWNSPIGLSVQTIDIYLQGGDAAGSRSNTSPGGSSELPLEKRAIPGRCVTFQPGEEWDHAIWVEGWIQKTFAADFQEIPEAKPKVQVDEAKGIVLIQVPISEVGVPKKLNVLVMGQEGYPSEGNWRVRDVTEKSSQWRFGGGSNQVGEPNVIDMLVPRGKDQAKILKGYNIPQRKLASIPLVAVSGDSSGSTGSRLGLSIAITGGIAMLVILTAIWALRTGKKSAK